MKFFRWLLVLACLGGYFLWPYHSVRAFARAVEAKDTEAIKGMVDAAAIRESMMDLAVESAIAQAEARSPKGAKVDREGLRAQVKKMMDNPAMQRQMERALSPDMLAKMLAMGSQKDTGPWRNEKWVSPITFSVQDRESEARAIFKFRGTGWKLCGLEVPQAQLRGMMAAQMAR